MLICQMIKDIRTINKLSVSHEIFINQQSAEQKQKRKKK